MSWLLCRPQDTAGPRTPFQSSQYQSEQYGLIYIHKDVNKQDIDVIKLFFCQQVVKLDFLSWKVCILVNPLRPFKVLHTVFCENAFGLKSSPGYAFPPPLQELPVPLSPLDKHPPLSKFVATEIRLICYMYDLANKFKHIWRPRIACFLKI